MDGVAIGLGLIVAGGVTALVTWPWWSQRGSYWTWENEQETPHERYEAVLTALRDLDFDHDMGKVIQDDHAPLRQTLLAEAADALALLDERSARKADLEARIEAEILAKRQAQRSESEVACPACGQAAHLDNAYCASCGTRLNPVCPTCGRTANPTDLFCAGCGVELALALS